MWKYTHVYIYLYVYLYVYLFTYIQTYSHRQTTCKNKDHEVKCSDDNSFPTVRPPAQP